MRTYADTSFIIPLYHPDDLTPKALNFMRKQAEPICMCEVPFVEARNSFRLRVAQKRSTEQEVLRALLQMDQDIGEGIYEWHTPDWSRVFPLVEQLSLKHTSVGAHRFADILHVACALVLESNLFLTFDERQARLAQAAGLKVRSQKYWARRLYSNSRKNHIRDSHLA